MGGIRRLVPALLAVAAFAWPASAAAERVVALQPGAQIAVFGSAHPESITTRQLTGLTGTPGETLVGLDIRPATGNLYAFSVDASGTLRFYLLDADTGTLTPTVISPSGTFVPGGQYATDFQPVVDRLRVVNSSNQNVRLNPATGGFGGVDTNLTFNPPATGPVIAEAYDRNAAGATQTTLYGIDGGASRLVTQGNVNGTPANPNSGQIFDVGPLGITLDPGTDAGLDIFGASTAYAAMTSGGATSLYTVDLASGAATAVGPISICANPGVLSIAVGGPDPAVEPLPNVFTLGKLKRNKRKGTATLEVTVPGPGVLTLSGKGVKAQTVTAAGAVKLKIVPKGKTKKKLIRTGKAKVNLTITYTPTGCTAASQPKTVTLKLKRR